GRPDVTVSNEGLNVNTVTVLLDTTAPGAVAPSLAAAQSFGVGAAPYSVAVGDVDGDGWPDLAVANAGSDSVSVLRNTSAPGAMNLSFAPAANFATGSAPFSIAM